MADTDRSRWVIIYPVYMDSKKTLAEGRRISVSHCCENPTAAEIREACAYINLSCSLESDKAYPRDATQKGRVRVQLKTDENTVINPNIPSRKALMIKVAELVPKHRSRMKKGEPSSSNAAPGSGKSGKGGRRKK